MFLDFYHLREQPFGVSPDPRYLYLTPSHREALASLYYGVESGLGFLALIAPPGMGKTTLLFHLLERWRNSARTAFIFETQCSSVQLLRQLLADLNADNCEPDEIKMQQQLNEILIRESQAGRRVIMVIDEAHNLDDGVLECVRLLSNFETASRKLLQIILAGQSPLGDKLARPDFSQLYQRISILSRLDPLTQSETSRYIEHRLRIAGYSGNGLFRRDALALIASRSQGIPRVVNTLCFNALSLGYAQQQKRIHSSIVEEVGRDLDLGQDRTSTQSVALPSVGHRDAQSAPSYPVASVSEFVAYAPAPSYQDARGLPAADGQISANRDMARSSVTSSRKIGVSRVRWLLSPAVVFCVVFLTAFFLMTLYQGGSGIGIPQASARSRVQPSTIMIIVHPNDTIAKISEKYLGRFDPGLADQIRKLNPELKDLNHIETGEQIRIPRATGSAAEPRQLTENGLGSTQIKR
jgi:type II secretory pathway predicted ATPase ExeA